MPPALPNEGAFAASGTCLVARGDKDVWFVTGGGKVGRVFHSDDRGRSWTVQETPIFYVNSKGESKVQIGDVNPDFNMGFAPQLSTDTVAIATGGGTIYTDPTHTTIASFGINGKRPAGFQSGTGGPAQGRINFDDHANVAGRHLNVPVTFMLAEIAQPQTGNQTGGHAQLIGDCTQPQTDCSGGPPGTPAVACQSPSSTAVTWKEQQR